MWKIADVEIKNDIVLAPMAGITSRAYRKFMRKFGVSLIYTEMISDHGICYGNEETLTYLDIGEEESPIAIQLFGSDIEYLTKAIKFIDEKNIPHDFIDINLGCPVPKVTKSGAGSKLLTDLDYLEKLMSQVVKTSKKPVTAKIRLGFDNEHINVFETIQVLEKVGVKAIAVHARTAKELYSGLPHYDLIEGLGSKMKVPLIISGNIFSVKDAIEAKRITHASAIMVARGALGNPELISNILHYEKTGEVKEKIDLKKQKEYCLDLAKLLILEKGEERAMKLLRGIAPKFFFGMNNVKSLRRSLAENLSSYENLENVLDEYIS